MNLRLNAFTLSVFTCVAAVPTNSDVRNSVAQRLFDPSEGEIALSHTESILARIRRDVDQPDMCSYRMRNITKLARVAGEIFVRLETLRLYRFIKK
jgi:hypothetical protein